MSLLEIRKKFIASSGRADLVIDEVSYADNGADWFIQAGQRYLDRMLETGNARARYFGKLEYSRNAMKIPRARVIEQVVRAYPAPKCEMVQSNDSQYYSTDSLDAPKYYHLLVLRPVVGSDYAQTPGINADISFTSSSYSGLRFNTASDQDYGIEITGLFYSPDLTIDTDISFWSEEHPEILVAAAFYSMERFYRNFEGLKECRASLEDMVQQLDFDYVAQEIVNIVRLEG